MKLIAAAFLILISSLAPALEKSDLVGKWNLEGKGELEEGAGVEAWEVYEFFEDGTYRSNGVGIGFLEEERQRIFALGGPEEGAWSIKGDEIHLVTMKMENTLFSSALEDFKRADFLKLQPDLLKEPTVYSLVSQTETNLVLKDKEDGGDAILTRIKNPLGKEDLSKEGARKQKIEQRDAEVRFVSSKVLEFDGFKFAGNLPKLSGRSEVAGKLRPTEEILDRLLCQYLAMAWVVTNEKQFPSKTINDLAKVAGLKELFLKEEIEILKTPREEAPDKFTSSIGWTMENMWALGWILGMDLDLDVDDAQANADVIKALAGFLKVAWADKKAFIKNLKMRSEADVIQMEDLFYCCHNAVRSAQTGSKNALPEGFHPVMHGGIIHEKRHALTWALSPKVKWDDTDLST